MKEKKLGFIKKVLKCCASKDTIGRIKGQHTEGEKTFEKYCVLKK